MYLWNMYLTPVAVNLCESGSVSTKNIKNVQINQLKKKTDKLIRLVSNTSQFLLLLD